MRCQWAPATLLFLTAGAWGGVPPERADILLIGDSHSCGCFGEELDRRLRGPLTVRSISVCGSGTAQTSWNSLQGPSTTCGYRELGPDTLSQDVCVGNTCPGRLANGAAGSLPHLLIETQPQVTIVSLGTNMLSKGFTASSDDVTQLIATLQIAKSRCIWIGPPQAKEDGYWETLDHQTGKKIPHRRHLSVAAYNDFNRDLNAKVTALGCAYVESDPVTDRGKIIDPMGLHFDCDEATGWADRLFPELSKELKRALSPP